MCAYRSVKGESKLRLLAGQKASVDGGLCNIWLFDQLCCYIALRHLQQTTTLPKNALDLSF